MKGKINGNGHLMIWRGNEFKLQYCMHGRRECGDWCPAFGELEPIDNKIGIDFCCGSLWFDEFEDLR